MRKEPRHLQDLFKVLQVAGFVEDAVKEPAVELVFGDCGKGNDASRQGESAAELFAKAETSLGTVNARRHIDVHEDEVVRRETRGEAIGNLF